ncbi:hypothetical protein [Solilutibacter pythonis]|uniref:hypothetical protein n=1 Tax=Solilutibacter pythonis TaxID=2483112 RepID=UPI0011C3C366|nr:hypothetical protein [Lysobacter pythonis]
MNNSNENLHDSSNGWAMSRLSIRLVCSLSSALGRKLGKGKCFLAAFLFIFILGCKDESPSKKVESSPMGVVVSIVESSPEHDVRIGNLYAHYENMSKGCTSGGYVYGAISYPRKVLNLGFSKRYVVQSVLDVEAKCPLEIAGFAVDVYRGDEVVQGGVSINSPNNNGVFLIDCNLGPMPPGACSIARKDGSMPPGGEKVFGWFSRVRIEIVPV